MVQTKLMIRLFTNPTVISKFELSHSSSFLPSPISPDEYFSDLIRAYREEIEALYNLGCRQIQIDDPSFCFICVPSMRAGMRDLGEDPEVMMMQYINVYNALFEDKPDDLIVGVHMCRGNFRVSLFSFYFNFTVFIRESIGDALL